MLSAMRKIFVRVLIVIGLSLAPCLIWAWEMDKLAEIEGRHLPETTLAQEDGEVGISSLRASGCVPIPVGNRFFLNVGADYQWLSVTYEGIASGVYDGILFSMDVLPDEMVVHGPQIVLEDRSLQRIGDLLGAVLA